MLRVNCLLKRNSQMCAYAFVLFLGEFRFASKGRPPLALCHPGSLVESLGWTEVLRVDELELHYLIGQVAVTCFDGEDPLPVNIELQVVFRHIQSPGYFLQR